MELVSVIIPTYKRPFSMVEQALLTALGQSYPNVEVLLVSDNVPGSEWALELAEKVKAYPKVRFLQMEKNSGAPAARNYGMAHASGSFFAFLDDDDLWLKNKLDAQIPLFSDPEVGLVYCTGYVKETSRPDELEDYFSVKSIHKPMSFKRLLCYDVIGSTSLVVIRRACFERCGGFDVNLGARQDYEYWLRICKEYKALAVPEKLFIHVYHDQEQISRKMEPNLAANEYIYAKYHADYLQNPKACFFVRKRQQEACFAGGSYLRGLGYIVLAFWDLVRVGFSLKWRRLVKR